MPCFCYRDGKLDLSGRTAVMGILNVTPDSFSDGGRFMRTEDAVARAVEIEREGADILDIGGQSTRPGHTPVSPREEAERLIPVLEALRGRVSIPISVDTYYPEVARAALEAGAAILNDVSGGLDNGMLALAAQTGAGLVSMYPGRAEEEQGEDDILQLTHAFFERAQSAAAQAGLPRANLCVDPGIGFGRTRDEDIRLLANLPELMAGMPDVALLVGASRKRVVGAFCGNPPFDRRLPGTLALHTAAQCGGANILRVHDVAQAVQAARVTDALVAARVKG